MEPVTFTCGHCGKTEDLTDDSIMAIVDRRRDQVMGMLSQDGGRTRGHIAFDTVRDEDGKTKLVARRRFPGVEIKEA